jgi:hypothetical protein
MKSWVRRSEHALSVRSGCGQVGGQILFYRVDVEVGAHGPTSAPPAGATAAAPPAGAGRVGRGVGRGGRRGL